MSLASFFPDLSSDPSDDRAIATRKAIKFLAKLALALRNSGHPELNTIELVAGSLVKEQQVVDRDIRVRIIDPQKAEENIIENLLQVLTGIRYRPNDTPLTFALEIAPGPLLAINSFDAIDKFCSSLDRKQNEVLNNRCLKDVGINLDIAHWNIVMHNDVELIKARFTPNDILNELRRKCTGKYYHIFRRICHSHISGYHQAAHFGDLPIICDVYPTPPIMNKWDASFSGWINLLKERMQDQQDNINQYTGQPKYSGYIICELEATANTKNVTDTIETLINNL